MQFFLKNISKGYMRIFFQGPPIWMLQRLFYKDYYMNFKTLTLLRLFSFLRIILKILNRGFFKEYLQRIYEDLREF